MLTFTEKKNSLLIDIPLSDYSIDVIYKCFYWYTGDYDVEVSKESNHTAIEIITRSNEKIDFDYLKSKIKSDLIDFKTRDIISKETKNVRDLIIAKAFSDSDEFNSEPPGEISDPVGFKIKNK